MTSTKQMVGLRGLTKRLEWNAVQDTSYLGLNTYSRMNHIVQHLKTQR